MTASVARTAPDVVFRWIDFEHGSDEDWARIEELLAVRGWASLNRNTSRVLLAEDARGAIAGFIVFQMVPWTGPEFVVPSRRGSGLAEELAERMMVFLAEAGARCWMSMAENEHSAALMEKFGMQKANLPVFVMQSPGGMEV